MGGRLFSGIRTVFRKSCRHKSHTTAGKYVSTHGHQCNRYGQKSNRRGQVAPLQVHTHFSAPLRARYARSRAVDRLTSTAAQVRRSSVTVVVVLETPKPPVCVSRGEQRSPFSMLASNSTSTSSHPFSAQVSRRTTSSPNAERLIQDPRRANRALRERWPRPRGGAHVRWSVVVAASDCVLARVVARAALFLQANL